MNTSCKTIVVIALLLCGCSREAGYPNENEACIGKLAREFEAYLTAQVRIDSGRYADLNKERAKQDEPKVMLRDLVITINSVRRKEVCKDLPLRVRNATIEDYPAQCDGSNPPPPTQIKQASKRLLNLAASVGKLTITSTRYPNKPPVFWGTGFLIAPGVVATTCHVADSFLIFKDGKPVLNLDGQSLKVDFEMDDANGAEHHSRCLINEPLACSSSVGVDVAFLGFDPSSCKGDLTVAPVVLSTQKPPDQQDNLAIVTYADLQHPIDAQIDQIYGVYKDKTGKSQFVIADQSPAKDDCDKKRNIEILLDLATTTVGESGGVLADISGPDDTKPAPVVAMHTCCATFFGYDRQEAPVPDTKCARLRRTLDDQAISIWSILKDPQLCEVLNKVYQKPPGTPCI